MRAGQSPENGKNMFTRILKTAWSLTAVSLLAGCASLQVQTDYDRQAEFTQLMTYDFAETQVASDGPPAVNSPLLARHIEGAVASELDRIGFRHVESGTPDFRIAYRVVADERSRYVPSSSFGFRSFYGSRGRFGRRFFSPHSGFGFGFGFGPGTGSVRQDLRGTLVVDIIDVSSDEVIYRGWASKSLDLDPRPEMVRAYVDEAVMEILADFPPMTASSSVAPDLLADRRAGGASGHGTG